MVFVGVNRCTEERQGICTDRVENGLPESRTTAQTDSGRRDSTVVSRGAEVLQRRGHNGGVTQDGTEGSDRTGRGRHEKKYRGQVVHPVNINTYIDRVFTHKSFTNNLFIFY